MGRIHYAIERYVLSPGFSSYAYYKFPLRQQVGWHFKEASPLQSVAKCTKPMLFIHGDADKFVPFKMLDPLYKAKPEPKEYWIAPGSEHARSYQDYPKEYTEKVRSFLDKWNK